jgi:hypothetical protein
MLRHAGAVLSFLGVLTLSLPAFAEGPSATFYNYSNKSLFPSAIVSTATVDWNDEVDAEDKKGEDAPEVEEGDLPVYGDENGWIGVDLSDLPDEASVTVEISAEGVLKPSKWSGTIKAGQTEVRIIPKAAWQYPALLAVREERPLAISVVVTVDDETVLDTTETLVLTSINECPFYVFRGEEGEDIDDLSWVFAAYVNENHPWIDGVLKDALELGIVDSFTGYQSKDRTVVIKQVLAIWCALQQRGIKYSDVSTSPPNEGVASQSVRFLEESIESGQANCVDGSVLMASILRKIGLNTHLVMVPGHCFLAFDTDPSGENMLGLETTAIGNDSLSPPDDLPDFLTEIETEDIETPFASFTVALVAGTGNLMENADKFKSEEDPNTQLISVNAARKLGIRPIASGRKRK